MQRIVFKGRVTPTIHTISIPAYSLTIEDANLKTVINTEVTNNDVTVTVGVEKYDPATIGDLARRAIRIVRAATDLVSFATGKGLNFSLEDVTLPDGKSGSPDFDYANARKLCTSYQLKTFASVLPIALEQDVSYASGEDRRVG